MIYYDSLFFMALVHHLKFDRMYRRSIITNINNMNSFHIQNSVQNFQSRPNWNVINVCRKNCSNSQIIKILHNKTNRHLVDFERMDDHREESFSIVVKKRLKRIFDFILIFIFLSFLYLMFNVWIARILWLQL